jgi:hypothetical protein
MIKTKKSIRSSKGPEDGTRILITSTFPGTLRKKNKRTIGINGY